MREIFGSQTKVDILLRLVARGGASGRELARKARLSPSQVFKALAQLTQSGILKKSKYPCLYFLNPYYRYHDEILSMVQKTMETSHRIARKYLPQVSDNRRIDPLAVYELASLRGGQSPYPKLSDILRKRYG